MSSKRHLTVTGRYFYAIGTFMHCEVRGDSSQGQITPFRIGVSWTMYAFYFIFGLIAELKRQ
jgi:hypothetical protein